jgi:hypothetical protein
MNFCLIKKQGKLKNSQSAFNVDDSVSNDRMPTSQSTLGTTTLSNGIDKQDTILEDK